MYQILIWFRKVSFLCASIISSCYVNVFFFIILLILCFFQFHVFFLHANETQSSYEAVDSSALEVHPQNEFQRNLFKMTK